MSFRVYGSDAYENTLTRLKATMFELKLKLVAVWGTNF